MKPSLPGNDRPKGQPFWSLTRRSFTPLGVEYSEPVMASSDLSTLMMAALEQGIGGWTTWVDAPHAPGEVVFVGHDRAGCSCKITRSQP